MAETRKKLIEHLFAEHGGLLRNFLSRRTRRRPDAADLAQEVYLRMLRVPDLETIRNPEGYLFTVANNLVREHARRGYEEQHALDIADPQVQEQMSVLPAFSDALDDEQRIERLREVLDQLPPKCRAVVVLQYWHHQSYQQIAEQLGISTHMVKKYVTQALVHCRRRMARLGSDS